MTASLSKKVALVATLVAVGSVVRFGIGELAMITPTPFYGIIVKIGLSETLTFIMGIIYGPVVGFLGGSSIIVISDLPVQPGPWTPFIAGIIGLLGVVAGIVGRSNRVPTVRILVVSAILLTLMSELLQNAWQALFYSLPIAGVMVLGLSTMITALVNNVILFTTVGLRVIRLLRRPVMNR